MTGADRTAGAVGRYRLLGPGGPCRSDRPGTLGGNGADRVYGRLDCPAARRALARGGPAGRYARHRVFFADAATARACGFRPCGTCRPAAG